DEEVDPPPEVHRVLVPLDRCECFSLELACLGGYCVSNTGLAVGLDLGAGRWFEVLAKRLGLLWRDRETHGPLGDRSDLPGRDVAWLAERARCDRQSVEDVLGIVAGT